MRNMIAVLALAASIAVGIYFFSGVFSQNGDVTPAPAPLPQENSTQDRSQLLDHVRNDNSGTSEQVQAAVEQDAADYIQRLQDELPIVQSFNARDHVSNLAAITAGQSQFFSWAGIVDIGSNRILTDEQIAAREVFRQAVSQAQRTAFPIFRNAYGPLFRAETTRENTYGETSGTGYRVALFRDLDFREERQLISFHSRMRTQLIRLRFREVRYRWNEIGDQFLAYDLETPGDGDLVIWTEAIEFRAVR